MESVQTKVATGLLAITLSAGAAFVCLKVLLGLVTGGAISWVHYLIAPSVAGFFLPVLYCALRRLSLNLLLVLAASCAGIVFAFFSGPLWTVPYASLCMFTHKRLSNRTR